MTGNDVLEIVKKTAERVGGIEKHITELSKTQGEYNKALSLFNPKPSGNVVLPGRGQAFGMDGRDFMDGQRNYKSLGSDFGQFCVDMAKLAAPHKFGCTTADISRIQKSFEEQGAWSPAGGNTPSEVVKKAWQQDAKRKAPMAEGAGATGGYLAPPAYQNDMQRLMAEESFLRNLCRTVPMTTPDIYIPTLDQTNSPPTDGSSFYGGLVWRSLPEAVNIRTTNETEPVMRQLHLVARTWGGICRASNQLMDDNTAALATILTTLFTEAGGWLYDFMILNGNGVNQSLGVRNAAALIAVTKSTAGSFVLIDAANMMARMLPASWKKCVFIAHPSVLPQLITMTTSLNATPGNFLTWLNPTGSGEGGPASRDFPAVLLGRPLYFTEKVPKLTSGSTGSVLLVDPDKIMFGDRMAIQIESSPIPYWESGQIGWRIMLRFDSQPEVNGPVILNSANDGSNYTVSPYVSLTD